MPDIEIKITDEARTVLDELRTLAEQTGNAVAAGLTDPSDDEARLAELFTRFDELVLSWVIA